MTQQTPAAVNSSVSAVPIAGTSVAAAPATTSKGSRRAYPQDITSAYSVYLFTSTQLHASFTLFYYTQSYGFHLKTQIKLFILENDC